MTPVHITHGRKSRVELGWNVSHICRDPAALCLDFLFFFSVCCCSGRFTIPPKKMSEFDVLGMKLNSPLFSQPGQILLILSFSLWIILTWHEAQSALHRNVLQRDTCDFYTTSYFYLNKDVESVPLRLPKMKGHLLTQPQCESIKGGVEGQWCRYYHVSVFVSPQTCLLSTLLKWKFRVRTRNRAIFVC